MRTAEKNLRTLLYGVFFFIEFSNFPFGRSQVTLTLFIRQSMAFILRTYLRHCPRSHGILFRSIPGNYRVLFLQGGATTQFSSIPLNLLAGRCSAFISLLASFSQIDPSQLSFAYFSCHILCKIHKPVRTILSPVHGRRELLPRCVDKGRAMRSHSWPFTRRLLP